MVQPPELVLGIDLGTTNSACAIVRDMRYRISRPAEPCVRAAQPGAFPAFCAFAQVSRSVTLRLNTGVRSPWSTRSAQK